MSRGVGELAAIQDVVPEWAALVVALVTQLGDIWFLGALLVGLYWTADDRSGVALVMGAALAGIGLYRTLKEVFALPRPEQPLADPTSFSGALRTLFEATGTASGYGFPSGHAVGSTVVYVGLASVLATSTRRHRGGAAAVLVVLVTSSRVVLGVHYLVDVVAGVAVGLALLGTLFAVRRRAPERAPAVAFALAVVLASAYLLVAPDDLEAAAALGAALGAFGGWHLLAVGDGVTAGETEQGSSALGAAVRTTPIAGALAGTTLGPVGVALVVGIVETAQSGLAAPSPFAVAGLAGVTAALVLVAPLARR